jgi:hypothetical protein
MERRSKMYSPFNEKATRIIYRLKRVYKKPMTVIADNLIKQSLKDIDKSVVCETCIADKNNDCGSCYLKGKENSNVEHADK